MKGVTGICRRLERVTRAIIAGACGRTAVDLYGDLDRLRVLKVSPPPCLHVFPLVCHHCSDQEPSQQHSVFHVTTHPNIQKQRDVVQAKARTQMAKVDFLLVPTAAHHYTIEEILSQEEAPGKVPAATRMPFCPRLAHVCTVPAQASVCVDGTLLYDHLEVCVPILPISRKPTCFTVPSCPQLFSMTAVSTAVPFPTGVMGLQCQPGALHQLRQSDGHGGHCSPVRPPPM